MDISNFKTDLTREDQGVWLEIGDGFAVRVCRLGCKAHAELYRSLTSPPGIRAAIESNAYPPAKHVEMQVELLAQTILKDWRGMTDKGQPVPYSLEKAKEVLQLKDFRGLIHSLADQQSNFRADEIASAKDALKKS